MSDENGHAASPDEQTAALQQAMIDQVVQSLCALAPDKTVEEIVPVVHEVLQEQFVVLRKILPDMLDPVARMQYPTMVVRMLAPDGSALEHRAAKASGDLRDADAGLRHAMALAFLLSPVARALIKLRGYDYRFQQAAHAPPNARIILPGGGPH